MAEGSKSNEGELKPTDLLCAGSKIARSAASILRGGNSNKFFRIVCKASVKPLRKLMRSERMAMTIRNSIGS